MFVGLERSQLELHLAAQGLAGRARWLGPDEFSARLGVRDPRAHRLFDIFMQPSSGLVYFPDYLLCAAFLSLQHAPLSQLLSIAFKLYDTAGSGRLTAPQFEEVATRCLGLCQEDAHNTFRQADLDEKGYLTYDEFISYAQKKAEFAFVFACDAAQQKPKTQ
ncbi:hypothetical protein B5X24_HaOG217190 [Helicoverpa armigera]|uniref:EF-hand domain-containing protein n=1 Tax=Helicoverpa armigera TaxID=29058 RepID=A0A2W1BUH7_HELAM|nr:hypothetical protein B5X24_HaOG217190 [Helicoverpa armigera]